MVPIEYRNHQREQRAIFKTMTARKTAAQLKIPLVGDPQFIITNHAFDVVFFLTPLTKLLGPIVNTRLLVWSFHEVGYVEFNSLRESNVLGSIHLKAKREVANTLEPYLQNKHSCQQTKTRAKVILVESSQGTRLSIVSQPTPDGELHTVSQDPDQWTKLAEIWEAA